MRKSALQLLEDQLRRIKRQSGSKRLTYAVPSWWVGKEKRALRVRVNPIEFYLEAVRKAMKAQPPRRRRQTGGEWTREAVIYNMFVRTTSAFDHDGDGKLALPVNGDGFRETGTFLKSLAILPYIRSLGANTVHLLPVTSIGHDGNKGSLGSPYAIRNPYELDENLSEPALGLDTKTEFQAFVEAAHRLGLRVVVEFVFRTAAKDADWVKEHPDWFYWIREEVQARNPHRPDESTYGSPLFTRAELDRIHREVSEHRFEDLVPPHQTYRDLFTPAPLPEMVGKTDGRYVGTLADGRHVKIPGAFADWPPEDNQPPWGDVTYLRMYEHPDFNYIGYNTIRMYDTRLTQREHINKPLWEKIVGIIPYYQEEFRIDGVMIDMGHALPMELKKQMVSTARRNNQDFAFWDENFSITRKSREEGYNAVFGFLWVDQHHPARMRAFCRRCATEGFPIPFFATPENHNTPRAASRPGGIAYARWSWVVNCFLPAVPFIHSGFELGERYPINTGLDFTPEQLKHLPSDKLPLFSEHAYDWLSKVQFVDFVRRVSKIRREYMRIVIDPDPRSFIVLPDSNENILAFARRSEGVRKRVAVVTNMNFRNEERTNIKLDTSARRVCDLLSGKRIPLIKNFLHSSLQPGQCLIFEY